VEMFSVCSLSAGLKSSMLELSWDPATQIGILKWLSVAPDQKRKHKKSESLGFLKIIFFLLGARKAKFDNRRGREMRKGKEPKQN